MLKKTEIYAHRGFRSRAPENTMPAFEAGLRAGADWIDIDVVLTKDEIVIASHDPVLNPDIVRGPNGLFLDKNKESVMTGPQAELVAYLGKYTVKHLTLSEIQTYDVGRINPNSAYSKYFPNQAAHDGIRIPTLKEVIQYVKSATHGKVGFQIEMKTDPTHPEFSSDPELFAAKIHELLSSEGVIENTEIQAFDFRCLSALRKIDGRYKTAFLTSRNTKPFEKSFPQTVKALGGYAWEPEDASLTVSALEEAHALGLKVVVWTWPEQLGSAFDVAMVEKMIDWKVDGIITDDPARLREMLSARGLPVPPKYEISAPVLKSL